MTPQRKAFFFGLLGTLAATAIGWLMRDLREAVKAVQDTMNDVTAVFIEDGSIANADKVRTYLDNHAQDPKYPVVISHAVKQDCWLCSLVDQPFVETAENVYTHNIIYIDDGYRHVMRAKLKA